MRGDHSSCPVASARAQYRTLQAAKARKVGALPGWKGGASGGAELRIRDCRAEGSSTATAPPVRSHDAAQASAQAFPPTSFDWYGRWWPVHPVESLVPKEPLHVDLLGLSLVVWADAAGDWHALDDKCPHRLAPLSEGRVEPQGLHCAYHGWTFDGQGTCTSIPQLSSLPADRQAAACASPRARVASYPTHIAHGLLWVWPQAGAWEAALAAIPRLRVGLGIVSQSVTPWFVRDLPIRYDTLLENVLDPSHVPYAHHGVQGNRYKPAMWWNDMHQGSVELGGQMNTAAMGHESAVCHVLDFVAPFLVQYRMGDGMVFPQWLIVPTKPGWSRLISNISLDFTQLPLPFRVLLTIRTASTAWHHAMLQNAIFDGDTFMLHVAERLLPPSKGIGAEAVSRAYYLPAAADKAVVGFRRWLQDFAGPVPTCRPEDEPAMPPLMSKEAVMDRWSQHTRRCVHCKKAVARIDALRPVVAAAGVLAGVAAAMHVAAAAGAAVAIARLPAACAAPASIWTMLNAAGMQAPALLCVAVALAALSLWQWLGVVRQHFFYIPYIHAHQN